MKINISADRLRELFSYDPLTGIFTNKSDHGRFGRIKAGTVMGSNHSGGYLAFWVDGKTYFNHRLAYLYVNGEFPSGDIDHINGKRSDNRFQNLRAATRSENNQNRRTLSKANTSGYLGVSFHKQRKKWTARIQIADNYKSLGLFNDKDEAYEAYLAAKFKFHPFSTITSTQEQKK